MQFEAIEAQVLSLPPEARSILLDRLVSSLETDTEWERSWLVEAKRRDEEIESGKVAALDGKTVIEELRAKLTA
jgi:Putative addiction module component